MDNQIRVLIAEDSAVDAELIARALGKEDLAYTSKWVKSKEEFLKALQEFAPGIVVCDYKMPGFGVPEALEIMKKLSPHIPFIVVSGTIGEEVAVETLKSGATDYVMKDMLAKLGPAIKRALEEARERTERKKAEEALQESEERYRLLADNAVDLIWTSDLRLNYTYISPSALRIFGFAPDEMVGQGVVKLLMPDSAQAAIKEFTEELTMDASKPKDRILTVQSQYMRKDGSTVWVEVKMSFMRGPDGRPTGVLGAGRDITERKNVEEVLKAANEQMKKASALKSEFVATVSHELRTPMTSIRETVSQMLDGILGETTENQRDMLSMCLEDIDRLGRIINDLLNISKLEGQTEGVNKELVDLTVVIENVIANFHSLAEVKGLEIRKNISAERPMVYADKDKITRAFSNLVGNALKFTKKGHIDISVRDKGEELECAVSDAGIGIAAEHLHEVFDKFTQFGRVDGPGEKGTGLGLAISKDIVELHGGKISVESTLDKGSKFIFTLPKQSPEEALLESIEKKIISAKREHGEFSIFIIRLDNYSDLLGKIKEVFPKMLKVENVLKGEAIVTIMGKDEMAVFVDVNKQNAPLVSSRIKRAVKEVLLETDKESEFSLSYGYATYPDDECSAKELLEKAESRLINEKDERFKKHIMIVDDDAPLVTIMKINLQNIGYANIGEAYDGTEAIEKIKEKIPDLVVLDMKMPKMSGYEVVGRLKKDVTTKDIPIIIMSGTNVEYEKLEEYVAKKAILVMGKPLDMDKLVTLINYLL